MDHLRRTYEQKRLERDQLMSDPIDQFQLWFREAAEIETPDWLEVNAMTLATTDFQGHVSARIVLLKGVDAEGFCFFTNYDSAKGQQLATNPYAALVLYWPHVERQVRIEGKVVKTAPTISDTYFHSRPRGSQIGAAISPQSKVVDDYHALEVKAMEKDNEFSETAIPRPDNWGGYCLKPLKIEFWQGRPNRLHDRFAYSRTDLQTHWSLRRLAP